MSAQKPMISPYEVNELTKYCLNILTYTDELRSDTALKQAYEKAKELENSIRKLKIASLMENKTLICVAGMQGAGKTTLMKNFYGLKGDALSIELGRGERIPVLITETDVTAPVMNAIRIQKNEAGVQYGGKRVRSRLQGRGQQHPVSGDVRALPPYI